MEQDILSRDSGAAEVIIPPRSGFVGREVYPSQVLDGALIVLAIMRNGHDTGGGAVTLKPGDTVLLEGPWAALDTAAHNHDVLVVESPELVRRQTVPLGRGSTAAIVILVAMVVLLATGAVPPVAGYCAASGRFDTGALILLLMFCLWQMPHSYAIAIFRFKDYEAAQIPVLPVVRGVSEAKRQIVLYILAFAAATVLLVVGGYAGYGYLAVAVATSLWWLKMALAGYQPAVDDRRWARQVFLFSTVTISALSVMMAVDGQVPAHVGWVL